MHDQMHAYSVMSINRNSVHTQMRALCYNRQMTGTAEKWRERLVQAIESDGRSFRAISLAAGLGPNYVNQLVQEGRGPTASALIKLLAALNVSPTHIITGAEMTPDHDEFLAILMALSPERRAKLLDFLRAETTAAAPQQAPHGDAPD